MSEGLGNIPPFFTNYGPASATAPGFLTTGAQTIAGAKTFNNVLTVNAPAVASDQETVAVFTITDNIIAKMQVMNGSATDTSFVPLLRGFGQTSNQAMQLSGQCGTDSGTSPALALDGRLAAAVLATRPVITFSNYTSRMGTWWATGLVIGTNTSTAAGCALDVDGVFRGKSYTLATLPAQVTRGLIWVSDMTGGAQYAYSDGTNWRKVSDNTVAA